MDVVIWGLVAIAMALAIPGLAIAAFVMALGQRRALQGLQVQIEALSLRMVDVEGRVVAPAAAGEAGAEAAAAEEAPAPEAAPEEAPAAEPEPQPETAAEPPPIPAAAPPKPDLEERLASRWLVWLGAVALALAGLFLVLYAVEHGWLGPTARVGLGLLLGILLAAAGEWVRRRPSQLRIAAERANYVPGALTGAGLFVAFTSLYGAHALYGLISPPAAFLGLAAVALLGFALAALHSPIVAIVGLLAGFATPALVSSDAPSAVMLFGYLALVVAAALGVVRYRKWPWLAAGALAGGLFWTVVWLLDVYGPGDLPVVAGFLAFLAAAAFWLAVKEVPADAALLWQRQGLAAPEATAWLTWLLVGVLIAWAVVADPVGGPVPVLVLGLFTVAAYLFGRRYERFDGLTVIAGLTLLGSIAGWPMAETFRAAFAEVAGRDGQPYAGLIAPAARGYLIMTAGFAALAAGLGYRLLIGARRPYGWAGASTLTAALLLAVAYGRLREVSDDFLWAAIASVAAALGLAAASFLERHRDDPGLRLALGIYAAATAAGIAFAFAFLLRDAWLTVALSLMLPALAWIGRRLELPEMRLIALAIATAVLVRLMLNPFLLDYHDEAFLGRHWVLYGYGAPAAAFYGAMRLFRDAGEDRTVLVLEGGALAFALLTVALELRVLIAGAIDAPRVGLLEASLQSAVWLASGWWRARAFTAAGRPFDRYAALVLIGLGAATVGLVQLMAENPLFTADSVGRWPIVNTLALAYLLPAALAILILRDGRLGLPSEVRVGAMAAALGLMLLWVSLEVRHWFQGGVLALTRGASSGELYALSAAWLAFAVALLGVAIVRGEALLRYAALGVLLLAVLKVFLFDMADLEGLYRVASFLGLGLALVGIGFLYQRFVYARPLQPAGPAPG